MTAQIFLLRDKAIKDYFNWVKQMSGKLSESLAIINIHKMHPKKCKGRHLTFYWIAIESEGPVEASSASIGNPSKCEVALPIDSLRTNSQLCALAKNFLHKTHQLGMALAIVSDPEWEPGQCARMSAKYFIRGRCLFTLCPALFCCLSHVS